MLLVSGMCQLPNTTSHLRMNPSNVGPEDCWDTSLRRQRLLSLPPDHFLWLVVVFWARTCRYAIAALPRESSPCVTCFRSAAGRVRRMLYWHWRSTRVTMVCTWAATVLCEMWVVLLERTVRLPIEFHTYSRHLPTSSPHFRVLRAPSHGNAPHPLLLSPPSLVAFLPPLLLLLLSPFVPPPVLVSSSRLPAAQLAVLLLLEPSIVQPVCRCCEPSPPSTSVLPPSPWHSFPPEASEPPSSAAPAPNLVSSELAILDPKPLDPRPTPWFCPSMEGHPCREDVPCKLVVGWTLIPALQLAHYKMLSTGEAHSKWCWKSTAFNPPLLRGWPHVRRVRLCAVGTIYCDCGVEGVRLAGRNSAECCTLAACSIGPYLNHRSIYSHGCNVRRLNSFRVFFNPVSPPYQQLVLGELPRNLYVGPNMRRLPCWYSRTFLFYDPFRTDGDLSTQYNSPRPTLAAYAGKFLGDSSNKTSSWSFDCAALRLPMRKR